MTIEPVRHVYPNEVESWIVERLAEFVNVKPEMIARDSTFDSFGIDSAKAIDLMMQLEQWLDLPDELPLELLFEAESIRQAAENIAEAATNMLAAETRMTSFQ